MLVTFRTDTHQSITFFAEVATRLLKMMGHSGAVPGAILAQDVSAALASLTKAVAAENPHAVQSNQEDTATSAVSLRHRALPLIALLQAAVAHEDDVLWS